MKFLLRFLYIVLGLSLTALIFAVTATIFIIILPVILIVAFALTKYSYGTNKNVDKYFTDDTTSTSSPAESSFIIIEHESDRGDSGDSTGENF